MLIYELMSAFTIHLLSVSRDYVTILNAGLDRTGPYRVNRKFSDITYDIRHDATNKTVVVRVDHQK